MRPAAILKRGDWFTYEFDYGDSWVHECRVGRPPKISEIDWDAEMPEPEDPLVDVPDVGVVLGLPDEQPD